MKIEIDPHLAEFIRDMCVDLVVDDGIPLDIAHRGMVNALLDKAIKQNLVEMIRQIIKEEKTAYQEFFESPYHPSF